MTKRILVVEDQGSARHSARSPYIVIETVDGAEGDAKAASERPDFALMDT
jgi:hypothetical protein